MFLLEVNPPAEAQFLFYLIPVTIGVQLSCYFFYQYFKIQDVNLKLNRILLSFGLFTFLIVFGALFLNVQRLFEVISTDILYRFGWAFALTSPVGFLSFITIDEFSSIMNLKFVRILMVLGLIPFFMVLIFGVSPIFMASLPFAALSAYYIIGFQIKLIRRTMGNIKKRFLQFFVGELISLIAIPFAVVTGLGLFASPVKEIIYYSGVALLTTGFLILFISAYDFPPFYEFEWQNALLKFFVINQLDSSIIYYCNIEEMLQTLDAPLALNIEYTKSFGDKIFSGGLSGIESVVDIITGSKSEKINRIQHENSFILLEYGTDPSFITYALIIKRDLKSIQHFLKSLQRVFVVLFREVLLNIEKIQENSELIFGSFNSIIKDFLKK